MRHALTLATLATLACTGADAPAPEAEPDAEAPAAVVDDSQFQAAPALGAAEWVKGDAVDLASHDGLVLVEHWATWCGPCKAEMPHLTAVQADHADDLTIVALSDEELPLVKGFVTKNPERMGYTVAKGSEDAMKAWATLASASGIPYSYLVRNNRILWHGHPGAVDKVLAKALDGSWTFELAELHASLPKLRKAYHEAIEAGTAADARPHADKLLSATDIGAGVKNALSWEILTEIPEDKRDLDAALKLAEQATAETEHKDMGLEDTLGLALFMNGKVAEAIAVQENAVQMCADEDGPEALCKELSDRLTEFKAKAAG